MSPLLMKVSKAKFSFDEEGSIDSTVNIRFVKRKPRFIWIGTFGNYE
ncbi:hypothetical protein GCM10007111_42850 [Virgibacillus kapii]|uniref:Uncharacterized protein n=1 Tax=Virgibacillus kapii TaxID=1638645 RepID=A0ABQ2DZP4_9BACI|nr:hypothetical protein GCM10007111_42850 [Virgibacillus kapii]